MRLVQKLSLAFIVSTTAILAAGGIVRAQREVGVLEYDRLRDHHLIGRALGAAVANVWRTDGQAKALNVLEQANMPSGQVHMRWVWLDGGADDPHPAFEASAIEATPLGNTITRIVTTAGSALRYTYVPLAVDPHRHGALELSESLSRQELYKRRVIVDTLYTTLILVLVSAGLSMWLGVWIVGRPVRALAEKARRVGLGDFSAPLHLSSNDEFTDLAREMNTMCDRLVLAHERVEDETGKKIAAQDQLRHADRLTTVGKLASGIAHELGTPLNVVSARAQMIAAGETTPAETLDYARVIVDATERMTKIIRQLLEFARRKGTEKTTCALRPLAKRTIELLSPLASKRDVTLVLDPDLTGPTPSGPGSNPPVSAKVLAFVDASAIEQVLTNLVVNAVQAMAKKGVVRISVLEERKVPPLSPNAEPIEVAAVRVTDEGAGIAPDDVAHVFEPFFTTKDIGEGTGLGLSVAYGIVQEHGGWIAVESTLGQGSAFTVYLPLSPEATGGPSQVTA